jgi:hypothetical protein
MLFSIAKAHASCTVEAALNVYGLQLLNLASGFKLGVEL